MPEKQPVFRFKEGTPTAYFRPKDVEGNDLSLVSVSDSLFTIKNSSIDADVDAIVLLQNSVDGTPLVVNNAEIQITFTAQNLTDLTPGIYVAELQLEVLGIWQVSDTFVFEVIPQVGVAT